MNKKGKKYIAERGAIKSVLGPLIYMTKPGYTVNKLVKPEKGEETKKPTG